MRAQMHDYTSRIHPTIVYFVHNSRISRKQFEKFSFIKLDALGTFNAQSLLFHSFSSYLSLSLVHIFYSCARVLFVIIIKNRLALTRNRNGMKT